MAFKISYAAKDPAIAQKVDIALTSFFVDENVRASQEQSEATTLFLDSQVRGLGQTLADRKPRCGPSKPSTKDRCRSNCRAISRSCKGIQAQLQAASAARERAIQQQTYLNSLQNQYQSLSDSAGVSSSIDKQLEVRAPSWPDLEARYTDDHPDVKKLKETHRQPGKAEEGHG